MGHDAFAVHSNGLTSHMNWRQFKKQFSIDGNFLVVREN
jgi:hypothetical protein